MGFALGVIFGVILTVALEFGMCWLWREAEKDIRPPYNAPHNGVFGRYYIEGYEDGYDTCWKELRFKEENE